MSAGGKSVLPSSWASAAFKELNSYVGSTVDPARTPSVVYDLYSIPGHATQTPERVTGSDIRSSKQSLLPGDILISKINPRINRVWIVGPSEGFPIVGSSEWIVMRSPGMDTRFLKYYFESPGFRTMLASEARGVGGSLTRAQPKKVADYLVPVPPGPEQKLIADKLDALLSRVRSCEALLASASRAIQEYRASIIERAVRGNLTASWRERNQQVISAQASLDEIRREHQLASVSSRSRPDRWRDQGEWLDESTSTGSSNRDIFDVPSSWAWTEGANVVAPNSEITYGILQPGPHRVDGVPYVRGVDIQDGMILTGNLLCTSAGIAARYSKSALAPGDVLLGIIRSTKVAIVPKNLAGANITQGTARFRPSKIITSEFLALALQSTSLQGWLHRRYRGIDMPGLNLADVRKVPIPLPPIEEQAEIARKTRRLLRRADVLDHRLDVVTKTLNTLSGSLLERAFTGQLVASSHGQESGASVLMSISTQRASEAIARSQLTVYEPPIDIESIRSDLRRTIESFRPTLINISQEAHRAFSAMLGASDIAKAMSNVAKVDVDLQAVRRNLWSFGDTLTKIHAVQTELSQPGIEQIVAPWRKLVEAVEASVPKGVKMSEFGFEDENGLVLAIEQLGGSVRPSVLVTGLPDTEDRVDIFFELLRKAGKKGMIVIDGVEADDPKISLPGTISD